MAVPASERVYLCEVEYPDDWDYASMPQSVTVTYVATSVGLTGVIPLLSAKYTPVTGQFDAGFMTTDGTSAFFSDPGAGKVYQSTGVETVVVAENIEGVRQLAATETTLVALRFVPPPTSTDPATLAVVRISTLDGHSTEIAHGFPVQDTRRMTILDGYLYFTSANELERVGTDDGATLAVPAPTYEYYGHDEPYVMFGAVHDGTFVYTIGADSLEFPRLSLFRIRSGETSFDEDWKVDLGDLGGMSYSGFLDLFALDGFLYVTNGYHSVFRVNVANGEVRIISLGEKQPTTIAADAQRLYWPGLHDLRSIALDKLE